MRSRTLTPGGHIDFASRLNELARQHRPGGPDAPNRIEEVDRLFLDMDAAMQTAHLKHFPGEPSPKHGGYWNAPTSTRATETHRTACRTALAELRKTDFFDRLDSLRGAAVWREFPPGSTLEEQDDIVRLSDFRILTMLCRSEMVWARSAGEYERIGDAFSRGMIVADLVRQQPTVMSEMTASACASMMLEGMRREITKEGSLPLTRAALLASIESLGDTIDERLAMEAYRLHQLQYLQSIHGDGGMLVVSELRGFSMYPRGDDAWIRRVARHSLGNATAPMFRRLSGRVWRVNELVDGMLGRIEDRAADRAPSFDPYDFARKWLSWRDAPLHRDYVVATFLEQRHLLELLDRRALRVLWAIEMHHAMTGEHPETLEALRPSLLGETPRDPFAPSLPLGYLRLDPTEADPRGYLLYSVGVDGVDNGGNEHPTWALKAADAMQGAGYDLTVNRRPGE